MIELTVTLVCETCRRKFFTIPTNRACLADSALSLATKDAVREGWHVLYGGEGTQRTGFIRKDYCPKCKGKAIASKEGTPIAQECLQKSS